MPFPVTHLRVAEYVTREMGLDDAQSAEVLLGAIAPDGVHYRAGIGDMTRAAFGDMKKTSHLCPVSDEAWGYVTDNDGWLREIIAFVAAHKGDFFALGYGVHVLTDLHNNRTIWANFRAAYPEEVAKGYNSAYYAELPGLDLELYQQPEMARVLRLLPLAEARGMAERVSADEVAAVRASIFSADNGAYQSYVNQPPADTSGNVLVTSGMMRDFVAGAVRACVAHFSYRQ